MNAIEAKYDLTGEAQLDLEDIAVYTLDVWGEQALDKYLNGLYGTFEKISTGSAAKRQFGKKYPRLFTTKFWRHHIFYVDDEPDGVSKTVAVFHEKMGIFNRLERRTDRMKKSEN